ncbi:ribosome biogenesis protein Nop16 [Amylocystis lapponica]|nr:ribosome biogenesis protein Nop16 [Amylocystis lapponica]
MANPRQRRKMRSGSHKPVQHSRRAKKLLKKQPPIRGPQVLQDAWDKHKTVRQNYEALGLVASLNPTLAGGVERPLPASGSRADAPDTLTRPDASSSSSVTGAGALPKGFGRIVRDEDGNVVDIQLGEEPAGEELEGSDDVLDPAHAHNEEVSGWIGMGMSSQARPRVSNSENSRVVQALEQISQSRSKVPRFSSTGERGSLVRLVSKYDQDVEGMARDRKLNPDQRTAGELSRAIKKAGGFAALGAGASTH